MYIVTGGCGFIGSNLVKTLLAQNKEVVVLEDWERISDSFKNLADTNVEVLDKHDFYDFSISQIEGIFHQGATVDTKSKDSTEMLENNVQYSKILFNHFKLADIPIVYASSAAVYGKTNERCQVGKNENPLNIYGFSKLQVDNYVRSYMNGCPVTGLRYFNVYGSNEQHKGNMSSMVHQLFWQAVGGRGYNVFTGTRTAKRDFISVQDVVAVNIEAMNKLKSGDEGRIINVGTGQALSFESVCGVIDLALNAKSEIHNLAFPEELRGKYQFFTEADITWEKQNFEALKTLPDARTRMHQVIKKWIEEYGLGK